VKRILVVNPFGIGDVLFSMTLVEAIRKALPEADIGFLCNERTQALVRMNPSIDHTFVFNRDLFRRLWKKHPFLFFRKLRTLLRLLKEQCFDTLFDLSLGREYSLFAIGIGIKKRIGFDFKGRGIFLTHRKKIEGYEGGPVAESQLGLLEKAGIPAAHGAYSIPLHVSEELKSEAASFLKKNGIEPGEALFAVAPGGGRSWGNNAIFKQWDPKRFAEVANRMTGPFNAKWIVMGDKNESGILEQTARELKVKHALVSGQGIGKVCALLLRSKFLLCNDGGLMHLAHSLGVKTVSIFGPVDEKVYGPYGDSTQHAVVTENVPCRPCYQKFYFPPCPYERRCLNELSVEKVLAAVERLEKI